MATINPYRKKTSTINPYSNVRSEINLRQEFTNMFDGKYPEIAKAQNILLRRMKRDINNNLIECSCVDSLTKEPDIDRYCPVCFGEGFLFDEEVLQAYSTYDTRMVKIPDKVYEMGLIKTKNIVFYTRYDSNITREDKILTLQLNTDGSIITPYVRTEYYQINIAWSYRSDNGRIEYWKIYTSYKDIKYLNAPNYSEI